VVAVFLGLQPSTSLVWMLGETLAMVHDVEQERTFPQGPGYEKNMV